MNAFVKTTNGNFPNPNFYSAWKGCTEMRFEVIKFEESDLTLDSFWMSCTRSTPVFAGVMVFDDIIKKLGVNYNKIDTYPESLKEFLGRNIKLSTLGEFRTEWHKDELNIPQVFMKPVAQKLFTGRVMNNLLDWIKMAHLPEDTKVYLSDPINFESEFRIYIRDGKIIMGKHYQGNWSKMIDVDVVKSAIKSFKEAPCSYALDFGLTSAGQTALVEFNDATSLGNYGMAPILYAGMLVDRWNEICQ